MDKSIGIKTVKLCFSQMISSENLPPNLRNPGGGLEHVNRDSEIAYHPGRIRSQLLAQVQEMLKDSGNADSFDAVAWLDRWLASPNLALGGAAPELYLQTPDGAALIANLIGAMASGSYF